VQDLEVHALGQLLDLHEQLPGDLRDPLMDLDLAELGVPVAGVAEAGNKHPLQDRVYACVIRVGLLQPLGLVAQVEQGGEHGAQEALHLGMLDGFGGEVVLHDNGEIERGEVDLVDLLVDAWLRLEHHASLVAGPQIRDVPEALCIPLSEGHDHASAEGLIDFVAGDERPGREAGGQRFGERPVSLEAIKTPLSRPSL